MKDKKTKVKESNSYPLSSRIQLAKVKESKIFNVITSTLNHLIPEAFKSWLNKQFLLSNIPNDVILYAMDQMSEQKVLEVEVILSDGTPLLISIQDIDAALKHLDASPFESIIQSAMASDFEALKKGIVRRYEDLKTVPTHELASWSTLEIHAYFSIKGFKSELMLDFIDHAPLFILNHLFKRLSNAAMWDVLLLLECQSEIGVKKQLLYKILDSMSIQQVMGIVEMIVGAENTLSDAQLISLRNLLSVMQAEKIPLAISVLNFAQKKILLGQFRERPMGVTMSIANGKMELYQIAAGLSHPNLVIDILNSVEWMDEIQVRTTRASLKLIKESFRAIQNHERQEKSNDKALRREYSRVHECCDKIARLKNERYHPLYHEINDLARLSKS